jgi:SAM-dependent methyltransferase
LWASRLLPEMSRNVAAKGVLARMRETLLRQSRRPRVLVIGAGVMGVGLEAILDEPAIEAVESDVSLTPRVQLISDAHDLPFAAGTFDAVIVQAVLEHVLDPVRCVAEIHRVLRRDGLVYADTPFMVQVHGRQFDFTRYTRLGHRRLFRRFAELESGISGGPAMALGWSLRYFCLSFCRGPAARAVVSALCRLAFGWLKYLDVFLQDLPAACDAAAAFYFLGRKLPQAISDRELIRDYRGGA